MSTGLRVMIFVATMIAVGVAVAILQRLLSIGDNVFLTGGVAGAVAVLFWYGSAPRRS